MLIRDSEAKREKQGGMARRKARYSADELILELLITLVEVESLISSVTVSLVGFGSPDILLGDDTSRVDCGFRIGFLVSSFVAGEHCSHLSRAHVLSNTVSLVGHGGLSND